MSFLLRPAQRQFRNHSPAPPSRFGPAPSRFGPAPPSRFGPAPPRTQPRPFPLPTPPSPRRTRGLTPTPLQGAQGGTSEVHIRERSAAPQGLEIPDPDGSGRLWKSPRFALHNNTQLCITNADWHLKASPRPQTLSLPSREPTFCSDVPDSGSAPDLPGLASRWP